MDKMDLMLGYQRALGDVLAFLQNAPESVTVWGVFAEVNRLRDAMLQKQFKLIDSTINEKVMVYMIDQDGNRWPHDSFETKQAAFNYCQESGWVFVETIDGKETVWDLWFPGQEEM